MCGLAIHRFNLSAIFPRFARGPRRPHPLAPQGGRRRVRKRAGQSPGAGTERNGTERKGPPIPHRGAEGPPAAPLGPSPEGGRGGPGPEGLRPFPPKGAAGAKPPRGGGEVPRATREAIPSYCGGGRSFRKLSTVGFEPTT